MKRFKYKTIVYSIITIMLLCASCAPSSKVVIYGTNGTEIYNSEYKMLGTILLLSAKWTLVLDFAVICHV